MNYKPGDTVSFRVSTYNQSKALTAATSLAVGVYKNDVLDAAVTPTIGAVETGVKLISFTIPLTYAKGDRVRAEVDATCDTIRQVRNFFSTVLDSKRIGDLSDYAGGAVASVTAPVSVGSIADGAITANAIATDAITAAKIAADAIGASELAADAVAEIQSGLASQSSVNTVAGYIDTEVAAIKAKTDLLTFDGSAVNASVDIEAFVDPVVEGVVAGVSELAGTGARTVTVTVTDGSDPVEGARVRLTQGAETYIATTDAGGEAVLYVDDGTWTYAAAAALFTGDSGTIVVNGDETLAITLTVITIAAPDDLNQINGYVYTRDAQGDLAGDVDMTFQLVTPLTTAGNSYGSRLTATSNNSGLLTVPLLRGATYQVQRGYGEIVTVTVPTDGASFALPVTLGDAA